MFAWTMVSGQNNYREGCMIGGEFLSWRYDMSKECPVIPSREFAVPSCSTDRFSGSLLFLFNIMLYSVMHFV